MPDTSDHDAPTWLLTMGDIRTNNSDIQKAIGQLGQYQARYGQSLILVLFDDFIETKHLQPFFHELHMRGIAYLVKRAWW